MVLFCFPLCFFHPFFYWRWVFLTLGILNQSTRSRSFWVAIANWADINEFQISTYINFCRWETKNDSSTINRNEYGNCLNVDHFWGSSLKGKKRESKGLTNSQLKQMLAYFSTHNLTVYRSLERYRKYWPIDWWKHTVGFFTDCLV